ncbi:MAG TPA: glycosyltransferase family A protein [Prosthecobacter sp.]|nr:glycosyltransferase family A protein [Prosthecobacter sp.]
MNALVSIIMPAYNAERTLADAIASVTAQTWPHWELILVVDCNSSDRTLAIAQANAAAEPRIRLHSGLPQGGCVFNRNHGISQAGGDYIAFLDSDDLWLPPKLEKQVRLMEESGADISCTGYQLMNWQGERLPVVLSPPNRITHRDLLKDNLIGCLTSMVRRSRFPDIRFVDHLHEDYILWLQLLQERDACGLPETLAVYRVAPGSRSGNKAHAALARWRILRDYQHLPLWRAVPCFASYVTKSLSRHARARRAKK